MKVKRFAFDDGVWEICAKGIPRICFLRFALR